MTAEAASERFDARRRELSHEQARLDALDAKLGRARAATFLATSGLVLFGFVERSTAVWSAAGLAFVSFVVFVVRHASVATEQFMNERRLAIATEALARHDGTFRAPEGASARRGDGRGEGHPYAADLDLFGRGSLYEQLNVARTPAGRDVLAGYLTTHASVAEIRERQAAARELEKRDRWREELAVHGHTAEKVGAHAEPLRAWARADDPPISRATLALAGAIVLCQLALGFVSARAPEGSPLVSAWGGMLVVQVAAWIALRSRTEPLIEPMMRREDPLRAYAPMLALAESAHFETARLGALTKRLSGEAGGQAASVEFARLGRIASFAAVRHNAIANILLNVFLLWDVWCAAALASWRARAGAGVEGWLAALGEIEALSCLGTFAAEHPGFSWPDVRHDSIAPRFSARDLAHPLIAPASRVGNDVTMGGTPEARMAYLVTGSNMSGKSTLLRAVGTAAVLAQAGAPVCASELTMTPLAVWTSIRVDDSLREGASRFYAEVRKLKLVIDAANGDEHRILFLLDEVLHGTNSRERVLGAKAVLEHLVGRGALGIATSHDLGLVELEASTGGRVTNTHFADHLEHGKLAFDYRMKRGPVATSNALRLMREVGIDVVPEPA